MMRAIAAIAILMLFGFITVLCLCQAAGRADRDMERMAAKREEKQ